MSTGVRCYQCDKTFVRFDSFNICRSCRGPYNAGVQLDETGDLFLFGSEYSSESWTWGDKVLLRDDSPDYGELELDTHTVVEAYNELFALVTEMEVAISRSGGSFQSMDLRTEYRERINAHHAEFLAKIKPLLP